MSKAYPIIYTDVKKMNKMPIYKGTPISKLLKINDKADIWSLHNMENVYTFSNSTCKNQPSY